MEGYTRRKRAKAWLKFRRRYLAGRRNHQGYYVCERCRRWSRYVELHHKVKRSVAPHRLTDPTNIELLCPPCHHRVGRVIAAHRSRARF